MFAIFTKQKPVRFFSDVDQQRIVAAIQSAERNTSGELRVFIESRCRFVDAVDRAKEVFDGLQMDETALHNAVVLYIALKDHQLAVYGDKGIAAKVGQQFWEKEIQVLLSQFNKENYTEGIITVVTELGEALKTHFPYDPSTDKNELPDDIVFGK